MEMRPRDRLLRAPLSLGILDFNKKHTSERKLELCIVNQVKCKVKVTSQCLPARVDRLRVGSIDRLVGAPVGLENCQGILGSTCYLRKNQNNAIKTVETK